MTQSSEKATGFHTKTPKKPRGRYAKRMAFYFSQRSLRDTWHRYFVGDETGIGLARLDLAAVYSARSLPPSTQV